MGAWSFSRAEGCGRKGLHPLKWGSKKFYTGLKGGPQTFSDLRFSHFVAHDSHNQWQVPKSHAVKDWAPNWRGGDKEGFPWPILNLRKSICVCLYCWNNKYTISSVDVKEGQWHTKQKRIKRCPPSSIPTCFYKLLCFWRLIVWNHSVGSLYEQLHTIVDLKF